MSEALRHLLMEDFDELDRIAFEFESRNRALKVPHENNTSTLHEFNININELYTEVEYEFAKARAYKDAIARIIENVLKDYYKGTNEIARKAAGYQLARKYPVGEFYHEPYINLFDLEHRINRYYNSLESSVKILKAKAEAKITNNSLLNIERSLIPR